MKRPDIRYYECTCGLILGITKDMPAHCPKCNVEIKIEKGATAK